MQTSFLDQLKARFLLALIRFPLAITGVLVFTVLLILEEVQPSFEMATRWWIFISLTIVVSLAVVMAMESRFPRWQSLVMQVIMATLVLWYSSSLADNPTTAQIVQLVVIYVVAVLLAYVGAFLKPGSDGAFRTFAVEVTLQGVISYVFAGVLMGGLSLALYSIKTLFSVDIPEDVFESLMISSMVGFAPLYFLANIPLQEEMMEEESSMPKVLKILGMYILLPILTLYLVILYVYLLTIVVQWELPDGWVSTLVSVLALGGFVTMAIVYPLAVQKDKLVSWLFRFFPLLLMPLLVLMSVGIARRLGDYGLTINRGLVLVLNAWLYGISIYLFITQSRHLKWIVISFAVIAFLSVAGPWNVAAITERSMLSELRSQLQQAGYLQETNLEPKLTDEQRERISELSEYLSSTFGKETLQPIETDPFYSAEVATLLASRFTAEENREMVTVWLEAGNQLNHLAGADLVFYFELPSARVNTILLEDSLVRVNYTKDSLVFTQLASNAKVVVPLNTHLESILKSRQTGVYTLENAFVSGAGYSMVVSRAEGWKDEVTDTVQVEEANTSIYIDFP